MIIAGIMIVACLANHLFSIFEKKAVLILLVFLLCSPLLGWFFSILYKKFKKIFNQSNGKRGLFLASSILLGLLAAILTYHAPVSYQTLSLQPEVTHGQNLELLEIKVAGDVLPINEKAAENNWEVVNGVFIASPESLSLDFTFPTSMGSQVNILFNSSTNSGKVALTFGGEKREIDLSSDAKQQQLITLHSSYRNIPSWIVTPFLILSDTFTFSLLFLMIFLLQEKGQHFPVENSNENFLSKKSSLIILVVLACTLHLLNALAVPLIVDSDSPSYLQGAVHLLEYGNLEGVSAVYSPGTTFLFAPILYLFGRNPWGMKLLLHGIAIASVLVSYRIGWQLSKKRWIAFCVGLFTLLIPDLYYYSNFIMSDLPNLFFILLFVSLLLDALDDIRFSRILPALIVAGFATILRVENILTLLIGVFILGIQPFYTWLNGLCKKNKNQSRTGSHTLGIICLAFIIALIPILWLSFFNYEVHGFFGLNNSSGMILYDGWVYYPEASGFDFRDETSAAVQEIDYWISQYPATITDSSGIATAGEIYPSLIKAGFSTQEAFDIIGKAAQDSIISHKEQIFAIVKLKLRDAFRPEILHTRTFPLPDENTQSKELYGDLYTNYFDLVTVCIPWLIRFQRGFYNFYGSTISIIYRISILFSIFALFLSLYRKPFLKRAMLALIIATRILIPNLMSIANWRYTVTGVPLLLIIGFITMLTMFNGAKKIFQKGKTGL